MSERVGAGKKRRSLCFIDLPLSWIRRLWGCLLCAGLSGILCLSLSACGSGGNTLMEGAAVGNSALAVYYYDGTDTVRGHLFDTGEVQEVLDSLAAVNAKAVEDWSAADLAAPFYGLYMMKEDGRPLAAVWSEGLWITQDGEAYAFEYDFAKLWSERDWQSMDTWSGQMTMPCSHALAYVEGDGTSSHDGAWDPTWMTPGQELIAREGLSIELVEWDETSVTVTLSNHSGEEWTFGEYYHLEVLLEGVWYLVPTAPGENWAVHDLAYILPDGGDMEMTYSLICYGDLPAGHYRLVAEAFEEELAVEKDIAISRSN